MPLLALLAACTTDPVWESIAHGEESEEGFSAAWTCYHDSAGIEQAPLLEMEAWTSVELIAVEVEFSVGEFEPLWQLDAATWSGRTWDVECNDQLLVIFYAYAYHEEYTMSLLHRLPVGAAHEDP